VTETIAEKASLAPVELVLIEEIHIGFRRRQKVGSVKGLARSIVENSLAFPVLIRNNVLVSGARRIAAFRALGRKKIPARRVDGLSEEQVEALELEENTLHQHLLDFETTKLRGAQIRQAKAKTEAKDTGQGELGVSARHSKSPHRETGKPRGRPKEDRPRKAGSRRDVAEKTGLSPREQIETERHLALATEFPFLKAPGWIRKQVFEAGTLLKSIPEREHPSIAGMVDQEGVPPRKALVILRNLVTLDPSDRADLYRDASSDDPHVRGSALSVASALPPEPDPGLLVLIRSHQLAARAQRETRIPRGPEIIARGVVALGECVEELRREGKTHDGNRKA
jgi:hypothetical protein